MIHIEHGPAIALLLLLSTCGGKVLVDESTAATSSGSGAASCEALENAFSTAFEAAVSCNACLDVLQCMGPMIEDRCGCVVPTNNADAANGATTALDALRSAGCLPPPCPSCVEGNGAACLPVGGTCESSRCDHPASH